MLLNPHLVAGAVVDLMKYVESQQYGQEPQGQYRPSISSRSMSCVFRVSSGTEPTGCIYVCKETYDKELTYMIVEVQKSQNLPSTTWRPK